MPAHLDYRLHLGEVLWSPSDENFSPALMMRSGLIKRFCALVLSVSCIIVFILIALPFDERSPCSSKVCDDRTPISGTVHLRILLQQTQNDIVPNATDTSFAELRQLEDAENIPISTQPTASSFNVEYEQTMRHARVAKICAERQELWHSVSMWQYKIDRSHNLIYCPIPKAGWSSWKRLLFYINGVINSTDVEIGIAPDSMAGILESSLYGIQRIPSFQGLRGFTFIFVRNPWMRLVSAYINKALDWNYTRILHTPCEWESMTPYKEPITFAQFLTCIADRSARPSSLDIHWVPMWRLCDFCHINYDHLGHLETMEEDSSYIVTKNSLDVTFPKIFSSKAHKVDDVVQEWYASIPLAVLQKLRKLYELDFLLNGYSDIPPGWEGKIV